MACSLASHFDLILPRVLMKGLTVKVCMATVFQFWLELPARFISKMFRFVKRFNAKYLFEDSYELRAAAPKENFSEYFPVLCVD